MPTLAENKQAWAGTYSWEEQGEEWSEPWGNSATQWGGCLFPRLHPFLPAENVLEIAPGFGRWTEYLKRYCDRLTGIDLSDKCVDFCKQRFSNSPNLEFACNDGKSLAMIPDGSIDLAFSFDSLVHAELDVLEAYITQFPRLLKPNGVAFIHHSNFGGVLATPPFMLRWARRIPGIRELADRGVFYPGYMNPHWRAGSCSAESISQICKREGLRCLSQEKLSWRVGPLTDCISVIVRAGSDWGPSIAPVENYRFMQEVAQLRRIHSLYGQLRRPNPVHAK